MLFELRFEARLRSDPATLPESRRSFLPAQLSLCLAKLLLDTGKFGNLYQFLPHCGGLVLGVIENEPTYGPIARASSRANDFFRTPASENIC